MRIKQAACDSVTAALSFVGYSISTSLWSAPLARMLEEEYDASGQLNQTKPNQTKTMRLKSRRCSDRSGVSYMLTRMHLD